MEFRPAWFLALFSLLFAQLCGADEKTLLRNAKYNEGELGSYVTHKFKTSVIEPPRMNFMEPFTNCDDGSYIFLTPRGHVAWSSLYIFDHEGSMIWGPDHRYGEVYNFQMQYYKGEPYLFFWAGDDSVGGHGEGKYYMLDRHYEEHAKISAGEGIRGDLHAFTISEDDTAIFTGYQVVEVDLSRFGKNPKSWIWESIFQELDIDTGEVLFEWRASEHFPFEDVYVKPNQATRGNPWDYFHINMVEKDKEGNYLVSTRYGRCVTYIDGQTGDVLWNLGGKKNSFKDLSGGDATTFLGQHDAHWSNGHEAITMFDNRADWFNKIEDQSAGHRIKVDLNAMTAELEQSFRHPQHILSTSQGSMQTLPNGNVLLGYGFNGAFTEFNAAGEVLCDAYFQPAKRFGSGDVQSYRDLKYNWTGIPLTTPAIAEENGTLYMSWLGSTKLRTWLLQDSDAADGVYESVQTTPKRGFETEFVLGDAKRMRRYVRAIAVDGGGTQLSISPPVDLQDTTQIWGELQPGEQIEHMHTGPAPVHDHAHDSQDEMTGYQSYEEDVSDSPFLLLLGVLAMISAVIAMWKWGSRCIPWRRLKTETGYGFRDDGGLRQLWQQMQLPRFSQASRNWHYSPMRDSREDHREDIGDVTFSNTDFSIDPDR